MLKMLKVFYEFAYIFFDKSSHPRWKTPELCCHIAFGSINPVYEQRQLSTKIVFQFFFLIQTKRIQQDTKQIMKLKNTTRHSQYLQNAMSNALKEKQYRG